MDEFVPFVDAVPGVDFGQFGDELVAVTLYEAAHGDEFATTKVAGVALVEVFFCLDLLKEDVDRLLFGVANEAAGVDNDGVAVVLLAVEVDGVSRVGEMPGDVFRVDGVFAAPEGDDVDFQL